MLSQPRVKYDIQMTRKIVDLLNQMIALYGYQRVETSTIESADLFLTKAGDQIITRLFTFERYGQQLALRPEFTAAAAYHYAQLNTQEVARWQFSGEIFEDDPNDFRHNYQRLSVGAELIGLAGAVADAEILVLAAQGAAVAQAADWHLIVGHVGLTRQLLNQFGLDARTTRFLLNHVASLKDPQLGKQHVLQQLDKTLLAGEAHELNGSDESSRELDTQRMLDVLLDATQRGMTMGGRSRHDIARRLLQKRQRMADHNQIVAALDFLEQWVQISADTTAAFAQMAVFSTSIDAQKLLDEWRHTLKLLQVQGVDLSRITIQPALARNWEYYTGMVFELNSAAGLQLAGGGRYDELVSLIAGQQKSVPAVGIAFFVDHLAQVVIQSNTGRHPALTLAYNETNTETAVSWANQLRERGLAVQLTEEPAPSDLHVNGTTLQFGQKSYSQLDDFLADLDR